MHIKQPNFQAQILADTLSQSQEASSHINEKLDKIKHELVDEDSQTEGVEMVDNTTDTSIDKEVDEEEMELEVGTIDKVSRFMSGLFGDGPKAKGIQTERKPLTERISQTDINGKFFQEKFILEQKLKDVSKFEQKVYDFFKSLIT